MNETVDKGLVVRTLEQKAQSWPAFAGNVKDPSFSLVKVIGFVIDEELYRHDEQLAAMVNSCDFSERFREKVVATIERAVTAFEKVLKQLENEEVSKLG
ncbi:hypothetical protein [Bacillus sp. FJAT-28004]|uniref:hypothetical protein n=1 Tax=Bacillus sp. FJAT-28004 TaxID=1679165 RepID=UPI0006B627E5|nr:hypothetical protein [Bacillus sp. FJAT-28004]